MGIVPEHEHHQHTYEDIVKICFRICPKIPRASIYIIIMSELDKNIISLFSRACSQRPSVIKDLNCIRP